LALGTLEYPLERPQNAGTDQCDTSGDFRDLEHDSDRRAERHEIENPLRALSVLELEQQWLGKIRPHWTKKQDAALCI
jgi:hypothetical protein